LWDVAEGKIVHRFAIPAAKNFGSPTKFHLAVFHPDGKTLLAVGWHPFAYRWDVATGKQVQRYDLHSHAAESAALSPDGQTLVTLNADCVRLFDLASGRERSPSDGHHGPVWRSLLTPDGRTALTASMQEGDIAVWDAATGREQYRLPDRLFANLLLASNGRILYALYEDREKAPDGGILVWDLATRKPLHRFPPHPVFKGVNLHGALAPDGKTLALAQPFGQVVYLFDAASGKEIRPIPAAEEGVSYLAFGPDSRTLVVVCADGTVQIRDVTEGAKREPLPAEGNAVRRNRFGLVGRDSFALSPDGKRLARVQPNGSPVLMELATRQIAPLPETRANGVRVFVFSSDNRTLAWVGSRDSTIHLMEVASGQERRKLTGHRGAVESLTFSRDGRLLISGSQDSTALVWDLIGPAASDEKLDQCWVDLAGKQADRAYQAMQKLMRTPNQAVAELGKHLRPIPNVDAAEVARLIADLDSEQFTVRQKARDALAQLGERAEPSLREAAKGELSLEARKRVEELLDSIKAGMMKPQSLRQVRAVEVLEQIGSDDARDMLKTLAKGMPTARLTREANAALERLAKAKEAGKSTHDEK
jgi:WD40 repeat protein